MPTEECLYWCNSNEQRTAVMYIHCFRCTNCSCLFYLIVHSMTEHLSGQHLSASKVVHWRQVLQCIHIYVYIYIYIYICIYINYFLHCYYIVTHNYCVSTVYLLVPTLAMGVPHVASCIWSYTILIHLGGQIINGPTMVDWPIIIY